ncbi:heparinase II/III family protein [Novosphingobium sp. Gsoil 351]|uniref:heparinase II/III family protein n=1 Tax=Novosphingobium sp. Gsoil 351 TaxID=2675225 RepID=UPI0012B475A5|nr:heparinase II/III family protein [Novosphingobium sp. Gsoil 351]QGN55540.1 heparinase [Novosphingobium sp. Gsoil 351]
MAERGELGLLPRQAGDEKPDTPAPALPLTASGSGDAAYITNATAADRVIEPGRALALADFAPPSLGAGERLVRLAYRLGVPGGVLRSPFRKAPRARLLATVENPLPGQRAAGTALRAGWLAVCGGRLALGDLDYASKTITPPFERALHGFRWLDDLAASGPRETGTAIAERLLADWLEAHPRPGKGVAWSVGNTGQRLLAWLIHAPLILSGHDKAFRGQVLAALDGTARWLDRHVGKAEDRLGEVAGWCAIVAAGLLLPEGKPRRLYGEAGLLRAMGELIGDDGGVLSRSPLAQIEAIELLVRLSACYRATRRDPPEAIPAMLALLVPPLLGLLHGDGGLSNWQGAGGIEAARIDALVAASGVRARPLREARQWGYQRASAGPPRTATVLVFDAAPPPLARHARHGCASTLAFELSAGKQRLVVNCGGAAFAGGAIPVRLAQGLRATAAHSTLALDDTNSTAVLINGRLGAGVDEVEVERRQVVADAGRRGATRIEAAHDGYAPRFGLTHRRILLLRDDGGELVGEDQLVPSGRRGKRGKVGFAIRFHLAPGVEPYLSEDGRGVALALPDGSHWQFRSGARDDGVGVALDDSLWVDGQGRPQATKQLVISGMVSRGGGSFPWVFKRMRDV